MRRLAFATVAVLTLVISLGASCPPKPKPPGRDVQVLVTNLATHAPVSVPVTANDETAQSNDAGLLTFQRVADCPTPLRIRVTNERFDDFDATYTESCGPLTNFPVGLTPKAPPLPPVPPTPPLPPLPTRDQLLPIRNDFQGFDCDTDGNGQTEIIWDPMVVFLPADQRQRYYACKRADGQTHLDLTLDQQGLATLDSKLDVAIEWLRTPGAIGILLHMMGDGNGPGEIHHDPGALGYYWVFDHTIDVYNRLIDRGLVKATKGDCSTYEGSYAALTPTYDGMIPQWIDPQKYPTAPWRRVEDYIDHVRPQICGTPILAYASGGYGWSYSGESGVGNWGTDKGLKWDGVLIETDYPPGPPMSPWPADFCSQSDEVKRPFTSVTQIAKRVLGPLWVRDPNTPDCEDPGSFNFGTPTIRTPRGNGTFYEHLYEYFTYGRVKLGRLTRADVLHQRAYFHALGYRWVN